MIGIIDYGCGNINAFKNAFRILNVKSFVVSDTCQINDASKIILPGVGSFDYVIKTFNESGLRKAVEEKVFQNKIPVLGVCAGMQILAEASDEGRLEGLCWVEGKVRNLNKMNVSDIYSLPHMGWNNVFFSKNKLFDKIEIGARFYFVHSYYFKNYNEEESIAYTNYPFKFCCAVQKKNIFGVQFHPEKSHKNGLQLLKNFSEI